MSLATNSTDAPSVDLYFDVVCPYAYLASTQLEAMLRGTTATLRLRPILLGGVFRELGQADDPNRTMSEARTAHGRRDLARWADKFGVPLRMPRAHPRRTVLAMRALCATRDELELQLGMRALFEAYWVRGEDVAEPETVARALSRAGLPGDELVAGAGTAPIKDALFASTRAAAALGVFGVPTFVVSRVGHEDELFWGQDRLDWVRERLLDGAGQR